MKKILPWLGMLAICATTSCKTDDVEDPLNAPVVTLSSDAVGISENLGSTSIRATLATPAVSEVVITISVSGTASAEDYVLDATEIIIAVGDTTGTLSITASQDTIEEGTETVIFTIDQATNATVEGVETTQLTIEDDDVEPPFALVLNEILYDPPADLAGDANGDGTRSPSEDEFLEFVNTGLSEIDLSGYTIYDSTGLAENTPTHTIPAGTILASGKALVIFGGGTPTGDFGGSIVQTSTSTNMSLNNNGDQMSMKNTEGEVVITFNITPLSNNPDESYTRNPDLTGDFVQHASVAPTLFSPGTKADGTSF